MKNFPKALLFDLNGTMIDDMHYHISAWHRILNNLGASISLEATKAECYGKNSDVLERVLPGKFNMEEKDLIGIEKEIRYREEFLPHLKLLQGLDNFLAAAAQQEMKMAIGSAAITANIDFVLDGLNIRHYFSAIVSADDVTNSKPDPETFLKCAAKLGVDPKDCIVFEDAPKGVLSAQRAGMKTVILTTMHTEDEFESHPDTIAIVPDYRDPLFTKLFNNSK